MEKHGAKAFKIFTIIFSSLTVLLSVSHAANLHKESAYRDAWCIGKTEVRLPNGNRADCVTTNYAIEVEFAKKYHEGVGQALDYAIQTGKKPAILLIIETEKDWRYYNKLKPLARKYGIRLWYITPKRLNNTEQK